jgi:flagellar motor switch/type III secretory pathway protein FliN
MTKLDPQIANEVAAHCRTTAGEIGQAFSRALGGTVAASVESTGMLEFAQLGEELHGPGLAVLLHIGEIAAAIVVADTAGILPQWYKAPDVAGQSRFTTLAQELGMLALPEEFMPDDSRAFGVSDLAAAMREGGAAEGAGLVRLSLTSGERHGAAYLVWPLASPRDIKPASSSGVIGPALGGVSPASEAQGPNHAAIDSPASGTHDNDNGGAQRDDPSRAAFTAADTQTESILPLGTTRPPPPQWTTRIGPTFRDLPPYTRSLLKIRVPLSVTLAAKKQPVGQILEIGPGSIIQFEKSCEEMLDLNVSNLAIARGEAVKVGEKFGLRVTSLILPGERFKSVRRA